MATKASKFRYLEERSGPDKPKRPKRPRKAGGGATAARNRSLHAARKGGVKLEDSLTKPSRKSTRAGKGRAVTVSVNEEGFPTKRKGERHSKGAAPLTLRATIQTRSPSRRAARGNIPSR